MAEYKPSAKEIKELREKTLAGFQDCQKALTEANGDISLAEEIIRKKGLQVAAKKAHREASDGLVAAKISPCHTIGAIVAVNTETDFAAKNEEFIALTNTLLDHVCAIGPDDIADGADLHEVELHTGGKTVKTLIDEVIGRIGENMGLKHAARFTASGPGVVHSYIHPPGKLGVLVEVGMDEGGDIAKADTLAHELALQIAFADPEFVSQDDIPEEKLANERRLAEEKAREQGKPEHMIPKIAEGMLRKFFKEECLVEQEYAKDNKLTIKDVIKQSGVPGAVVRRFARFALK
ncbi:MAG: translation elongation factor Ts [bacterium]|nr:translation elongation factor Ts [bacterium]